VRKSSADSDVLFWLMFYCRLILLMSGSGYQIPMQVTQLVGYIGFWLIRLQQSCILIVSLFRISLFRLRFLILHGVLCTIGYLRSIIYLNAGAFVITLFCAQLVIPQWRCPSLIREMYYSGAVLIDNWYNILVKGSMCSPK
jgi:hypothetical protein